MLRERTFLPWGEDKIQRSWKFLLAGALMLIASVAIVNLSPSLAILSTPDFSTSDRSGIIAALGRSSLSWTAEDLLAKPGESLRSDRAVVVPLSCGQMSEDSTWLPMLARAASRLRASSAGQAPRSNGAVLAHIDGLRGRPIGTVSRMLLPAGDVYRLTGIAEFLFVCVPPSGFAADRQVDQLAAQILRVAKAEAAAGRISQVAIPRMPIVLTGQDLPDQGGAQIFWSSAVKEGLDNLDPGLRLDVVFGLYSLSGKDNRGSFIPIAQDAVAQMRPADSTVRTGILMTGLCFFGAALSAWYRGRRFHIVYVVAMLCFCTAGMGAILALFQIDAVGSFFLRSWGGSTLRLAAAFTIGLFGERLMRFDWRRAFTE